MYRAASYLCAAVAFGLIGWSAFLALRKEPWKQVTEEPPIEIDPVDRDLGEVPRGAVEVAFDVTNPATRPRRIIGFAEG